MIALLDTPLFGIFLSLAAYAFGVFIHKKTGLLILHPLLIALCCVIGFLSDISCSAGKVFDFTFNIIETDRGG